jgi:ABC-type Fe3+/spermidine/putrescine transport system ATPase subunit
MSLRLSRLTKDFATRGGAAHRAVDDLSLEIEHGTFCTLLGPSGCGKTTLLRLIAGFEQPTSGAIEHDGRSLASVPPYRRGFPMVFQSFALFPHMTVRRNIEYGLRIQNVRGVARRERTDRALALLDLEAQAERYPGQLSGGQQQRVALARCLVVEPKVILLDEPLSNLDAELRISMRREIRALQRRLGITAIYVTHDQEESLAISDRIVVMNEGRVEQDGTPADIYARPRTRFVARFMGIPNIFPVTLSGGRATLLGRDLSAAVPDGVTTAVIRPDAAILSAGGTAGDASLACSGVVEDTTFLGSRVQHVIRLDAGERLTVESPADTAAAKLAPGDAATCAIAYDRLHFI